MYHIKKKKTIKIVYVKLILKFSRTIGNIAQVFLCDLIYLTATSSFWLCLTIFADFEIVIDRIVSKKCLWIFQRKRWKQPHRISFYQSNNHQSTNVTFSHGNIIIVTGLNATEVKPGVGHNTAEFFSSMSNTEIGIRTCNPTRISSLTAVNNDFSTIVLQRKPILTK